LAHRQSGKVSLHTIDCQFIQPERMAVYLIQEGDRAVLVDSGTAYSIPLVLRAMAACGLSPGDLEYIILTHIHLDHAGGTSSLLRACPRSMVLSHPQALRHLRDPSRLLASAERIYGKELLRALYGPVEGVEWGRIRMVADGEELNLGERRLTFLLTPGHADHHLCVHDSRSNGIFVGDTFGVCYGLLRRGDPPCLLPSCPPTDFDPQKARDSIRRILATGAATAFLSHFGEYPDLGRGAEQLLTALDRLEDIVRQMVDSDQPRAGLLAWARGELEALTRDLLAGCGIFPTEEEWMWLQPEIGLNAQGLVHAGEILRSKQGS